MTLRLASIAATGENQYLLVWRGDGGEEYSMSCEVEEGVRTGRPADEMTLLHPKPADLFMRGGINPRVISAASGAFHKARAERADLAAIENIKRPGS
jgi:hypothetical protein